MKRRQAFGLKGLVLVLAAMLVVSAIAPDSASADPTTIYDIQYTTDATGDSPLDGTTIADFAGGIVIHKFAGSRPRLALYDPAHSDGWGGIQLKDWTAGGSYAKKAYENVQVGDWVSFTNVVVEEYRGGTFLQYDGATSPTYKVESTGNALPSPIVLTTADIAAPVENPAEFWLVANHAPSPEQYESMLVQVRDVTVSGMDQGKNLDNYVLSNTAGNCWASDYMNEDKSGLVDYHSLIAMNQHFESVTGIFEQYTKISSSNPPTWAWDYYQLLTTSDDSLVVPEPASMGLLLLGGAGLMLRRRRKRA